MPYKYEESYDGTLNYFNGDELATSVFLSKYALQDKEGNFIEKTPDDMFHRIAKEFSRIEKNKFKEPLSEDEIYGLLKDFKYIVPQGSPLFGIGNHYQYISLSNCFVLESPSDSYGGILKTDEELVQISKRRGGVGIDISNLRPEGFRTSNASKSSTGIIPFMQRYSNSINEVGQNGRRGALMLTISIHHKQIEDFINSKTDLTKITGANISVKLTDEFLNAVKNNEKYELRFPIDYKEKNIEPEFSKMVDANIIWNKIIKSAHSTAEPGILFWDNIIENSPADSYASLGFSTISTNPCVVGDTLVAVADGRMNVSIKELSIKGEDVPVYCFNDKGETCVQLMRNPRITGYNQKIYKIILDDGSILRTTYNHKFLLKNGEYKEVKDLNIGDSLEIMTKYYASFGEVLNNSTNKNNDYIWVNNKRKNKAEHRLIAEFVNNIKLTNDQVVHHKNHTSIDNSLSNLEVMYKKDHDELHSQNMKGNNNPYFRMSDEWKKNFHDNRGEKNGKYSGLSKEDIEKYALELTKKLNRRFSKKDWTEFCNNTYNETGIKIPKTFSNFRNEEFNVYIDVTLLAKWAANELKLDIDVNMDPRIIKTYQKMIDMGYHSYIEKDTVYVEKICECCNKEFYITFNKREQSYCSSECSHKNFGKKQENITKLTKGVNEYSYKKAEINKENQIKIYLDLKFQLNREPLKYEFENQCKIKNVPFRFKTKYGFENYDELKEESTFFNHKIISIEFDGYEDVYNGTVDLYHNFFIGGFKSSTKSNKDKFVYVNNKNCGEIPLSPYDSCRLMVLNLFSYVNDPFTENANFDFVLFSEHVQKAQRLMDNLIDLEIEHIDRIIEKISNDPEDVYVLSTELSLWKKIKQVAINGRRTGLGLTALGDCLAGLNLGYATDKSLEISDAIYQSLMLNTYKSSVDMAKELEPFPIWNHDLEKDNKFLLRIKKLDSNLYDEMKIYGRRNISCNTSAPVGSISILTGTTSGIEPIFMMSYKRRKKINTIDKDIKPDFVDQNGIKWKEFDVYHQKIKLWMDITGESDINKSPWYKNCADDIDWEKRVKLQAIAQKSIDHSISVTVNLPESATVNDIKIIYETAWKSGCKGSTVYRKNSRSGVLIDNSQKLNEHGITKTTAPKRPKSINAEVYHFKISKEDYNVVVGLLNDEPYEIFVSKYDIEIDNTHIPKEIKDGKIIKMRRGHYELLTNDKNYIISGESLDDTVESLTRMISTSLRHGVDISFIVQQLEKTKGDLYSFSKALSRALKKYIKDGEKVSGDNCPECGSNDLIREQGCVKCDFCGWTRC